jgi:hypothetical protein
MILFCDMLYVLLCSALYYLSIVIILVLRPMCIIKHVLLSDIFMNYFRHI